MVSSLFWYGFSYLYRSAECPTVESCLTTCCGQMIICGRKRLLRIIKLMNRLDFAIRKDFKAAQLTNIKKLNQISHRLGAEIDTTDNVILINDVRHFYELYRFEGVAGKSYVIEVTGRCSNCASTSTFRTLPRPMIYLLDLDGTVIKETYAGNLSVYRRNPKYSEKHSKDYNVMDTKQTLKGQIEKSGT